MERLEYGGSINAAPESSGVTRLSMLERNNSILSLGRNSNG